MLSFENNIYTQALLRELMTNNLATDQRQSWRWLQAWQSPVNIQSDRTPSSSDTCDGHTDPWTISTSSSSHRFLPPSASRCSWKPTCTLTTYHKWSCPVPFLLKPEHQSAQMSKITNPVWHRMLYSCTHNMATVGVRGLKSLAVPTQSTGIIDTAGRCRHMPFQQAFFRQTQYSQSVIFSSPNCSRPIYPATNPIFSTLPYRLIRQPVSNLQLPPTASSDLH